MRWRTALGIAAALEAAHQGGVIHRDLKPANVMVDEEGGVMVLDFGLGKVLHPPGGSEADAEDPSASPTLTAMTEAHVRLGTAPYMSPEQVNAKPVDSRSDVWSFGCTLCQQPPIRSVGYPTLGAWCSSTVVRFCSSTPVAAS